MTTLTEAEIGAIFDEHTVKFPELTNQINELKTYYVSRMWHQMTDCLLTYVRSIAFDRSGDGNELIVFYEKMIEKLNFRLNPIKYALITIACSRQFESIEDSIKFLETSKERLKKKRDAVLLLEIAQADKKLALGQHHDCFDQLNEIRQKIEQASDVDSKVFSSLAQVYGLYYKRKDDNENYYKSCLQYLAYTDANEMSDQEKRDLSIKMSMAILLGKNVFNISELLDKEIIKSLVGSDFEWLYELINCLGQGDIDGFTRSFQRNHEFISKYKNIVNEETYLDQKVRIIAFLEMIFQVNKDERSLSFQKIAETCKIESVDVEFLVMKAMSLELIRGTIDEVAQVVHIDWCLPRYLSKSHLQIMSQKMNDWEQKLDNVIRLVQNNASELVQS